MSSRLIDTCRDTWAMLAINDWGAYAQGVFLIGVISVCGIDIDIL